MVCGGPVEDHELTYNARGERTCILCALDRKRRSYGFVRYWYQVKTTSPTGKRVNRELTDKTAEELRALEEAARELYGPGYNKEVLKKRAEVRAAIARETNEAHAEYRRRINQETDS